jgi:hypothetical protein
MAQVHFLRSDVEKLLKHALEAKTHSKQWGDEAPSKPQLMLVGDEGIYLMSNGEPRLPDPHKPESNFVVYARECNPKKMSFDSWWSAKNRIFGGDDGAEYLDAADVQKALSTYPEKETHLIMQISASSISLVTFVPKKPAAAAKPAVSSKAQLLALSAAAKAAAPKTYVPIAFTVHVKVGKTWHSTQKFFERMPLALAYAQEQTKLYSKSTRVIITPGGQILDEFKPE